MTETTLKLFRIIQEFYCYIIKKDKNINMTADILQSCLEQIVIFYNYRYKTHFNPSKTIHFYMENYDHEI